MGNKISVGDLVILKVNLTTNLSCSISEIEFVECYANQIGLVTDIIDDREVHIDLEPVRPNHSGSHYNENKVGAYLPLSDVEQVFTV